MSNKKNEVVTDDEKDSERAIDVLLEKLNRLVSIVEDNTTINQQIISLRLDLREVFSALNKRLLDNEEVVKKTITTLEGALDSILNVRNEVTLIKSRLPREGSWVVEFSKMLIAYYNKSELTELALTLKIPLGVINEDSTISDYARNIVLYCERHGITDKLIATCSEQRPKVFWPVV